MGRGPRAAFLPIAITFGILAVVFAVMGQQVWIAFLPIAITFAVLTFVGADDDEDETSDGASESTTA